MAVDQDYLKSITNDLLLKAQQCEENGGVLEATDLYEEGIEQLKNLIIHEKRPAKLEVYRKHLDDHMAHVQELRTQFDYHNRRGKMIEQINIPEGSREHGYENVFGKYLTPDVKEILIYEPKFVKRDSMTNLIHFLELLVKKCYNARYVRFITRGGPRYNNTQVPTLKRLRYTMATKNINFVYRFNDMLVEHMIVLNNGFIIKSPLGLNYFYPNNELDLGLCDFDYRRCIKTVVNVWSTCPFMLKIRSY